jgi:hypothetical protein
MSFRKSKSSTRNNFKLSDLEQRKSDAKAKEEIVTFIKKPIYDEFTIEIDTFFRKFIEDSKGIFERFDKLIGMQMNKLETFLNEKSQLSGDRKGFITKEGKFVEPELLFPLVREYLEEWKIQNQVTDKEMKKLLAIEVPPPKEEFAIEMHKAINRWLEKTSPEYEKVKGKIRLQKLVEKEGKIKSWQKKI